MSTATSRNSCFMPSQSWLTTSQLTMGACPSADATVKPFATRPVLLSYTNAAPTAIRTPRIIPNKICLAGVSHRSGRLNARTFTKATARSISSCRTLVRDCDEDRTKAAAYSRRCLHLDTHLTIGSIARVRTKIQATITAHVSATAPDGTTTLRKSGTTSTTLRDTATAKSDHSAQFFIADNNRVPSLVVAGSSDKTPCPHF